MNLKTWFKGLGVFVVSSLVTSLAAAYGEGATVDEARLAPFLGHAGSVPPWELTGAIDDGDVRVIPAVQFYGVCAVDRFGNHGDAGLPVEYLRHPLAHDGVVVGQEHADLLGLHARYIVRVRRFAPDPGAPRS